MNYKINNFLDVSLGLSAGSFLSIFSVVAMKYKSPIEINNDKCVSNIQNCLNINSKLGFLYFTTTGFLLVYKGVNNILN